MVTFANALKSLKLLENTMLFLLERRWAGFSTGFIYSSNLHKMPSYVIITVCYLLCSILTSWDEGHNPWVDQDFIQIIQSPKCNVIFPHLQPILISILASGNPTGEILLNWFNAGFLSLTMLTFYCNGYSVEDVFVNIPFKKIQYKLANESGVIAERCRIYEESFSLPF